MKLIKINFLAVIALMMTWGCVEEERTVISDNPGAPQLSSPAAGSALVLTEDTAGEWVRFEFTPADFGYQAAVNYTVQVVPAGQGWENPMDVASSNSTIIQITQSEWNQRLIGRGYAADQENEVDMRIRASVGTAVAAVYSPVVSMLLVPYSAQLTYARVYLPGDYQGWSPENPNTVIYSVNDDDIYDGYVHILGGSGAFKINATPSWDENYGGVNGVLEQNGPDIILPEPFGTFRLIVDMNAGTYTIGERRRWGLVGDATPGGWDADTPMEFNAAENVLTVTLDLVAGNFKFRGNNNWDFNYGDTGLDGVLDAGGADIPIAEPGNYTVTMDWKTPGEITYEVIKN